MKPSLLIFFKEKHKSQQCPTVLLIMVLLFSPFHRRLLSQETMITLLCGIVWYNRLALIEKIMTISVTFSMSGALKRHYFSKWEPMSNRCSVYRMSKYYTRREIINHFPSGWSIGCKFHWHRKSSKAQKEHRYIENKIYLQISQTMPDQ